MSFSWRIRFTRQRASSLTSDGMKREANDPMKDAADVQLRFVIGFVVGFVRSRRSQRGCVQTSTHLPRIRRWLTRARYSLPRRSLRSRTKIIQTRPAEPNCTLGAPSSRGLHRPRVQMLLLQSEPGRVIHCIDTSSSSRRALNANAEGIGPSESVNE